MPQETQESKTSRLAVACTPSEEHAAKAVALMDKVPDGVSGLLRIMSLNDVIDRYEKIQAAKPPLVAEGAVV